MKCCMIVNSVSLSWPIQSDHLLIADRMIMPLSQDPVHSWKAGPGEVMTVANFLLAAQGCDLWIKNEIHSEIKLAELICNDFDRER